MHRISNINDKPLEKCSLPGTWLSISKTKEELEEWNISLDKLLVRKIGAGDNTYFWKYIWFDSRLSRMFIRVYTTSNLTKITKSLIGFLDQVLRGIGVGKGIQGGGMVLNTHNYMPLTI